ncbi:transposase [Streptomyces sp. NPDC096152]|uniref:transposase n=1 Tax=Streptomyces sp. NPDC096152 TaxID=3366078 RepID=UPI00381782AA
MAERRPYPSDLSDARWELIEPVLSAWRPESRRHAAPRTIDAYARGLAMHENQWASDLHGIHRALAALGHAEPPPRPRHGPGPAAIEGASGSWADWVERWHTTSTLTPRVRASYGSAAAGGSSNTPCPG